MEERFTHLWSHPREIREGEGRIIYLVGIGLQPSGWHLPGGLVTVDPERARSCAIEIDRMLRKSGRWPVRA